MFALYLPKFLRHWRRLHSPRARARWRARMTDTRVAQKFGERIPKKGKNTAAHGAHAAQAARSVLNKMGDVDKMELTIEDASGHQVTSNFQSVRDRDQKVAVGAVAKVMQDANIPGGYTIPKNREGARGTASQPARPPRCAASPAPLASLPAGQLGVHEGKESYEVEAERRVAAEGERRAREADKRARESSQREADRASAATSRGSAPKRGRPEESVDLTSDGDEDAAEPSHPPSRPRTTSQGPATQPCPPAGAASGPAPAPADTCRAAGRQDGSASVSSSSPRTTRSRDAVDLDEEPDEEVVTMQMRKVELGTFDCGACQVAFTEKAIRFYTDEAPRFQPMGYHEEIELDMAGPASIQIDKQRGLMCVTGFFGYDVPGHYSAFAVTTTPQNRALFHFNTSEGDGVWSGSDRDKRVKSLMRLSQDIKIKTHFNPNGTDFAAELRRFKRRQTGEEHVPKPPKPAAGRGSRAPPPSSRGSLLQERASGSGSGGAGRGSGSAGTGRFPGPGQRVDGRRTDGTPPIDQFMADATPRPIERDPNPN